MGLICSYLLKCNWADGFPLDIVEIKLQWLCAELKYLWYVAITAIHLLVSDLYSSDLEVDSTIQKWPFHCTAPTSKLTDANNAAQPELSYQHQAVQAFCTQAQEAPMTLKSLVESTKTPTMSLLAPNVPTLTIVHVDTGCIESGGDSYVDADCQPNACMFFFGY